jgi:hypothetical protein
MKNPILLLLGVSIIGLGPGCVTGRRSFGVDVPPAQTYTQNAGKGSIGVGQVSDARGFENRPDSPSTPSVNGDVNQLSAAEKNTFIGRQRNGFGHAMGDITLPEGQTVQGKIAELLREGMKRRGYDVAAAAPEGSVTAEIQKFWSWMTPGFFALSFEAEISCKVTVSAHGKQATFIVKGYGLNHGQFAKDVNWREAYDIAFQDFLANLNSQLDASGF